MRAGKHILFWILASLLLWLGFGSAYNAYLQSFYFVTFLLPVAIGVSYFFNYYLMPVYLLEKRYLRFGLYSIYTLIVSVYMMMVVITISFIILANYRYEALHPTTSNIFVLAYAVYFIVFLKAFYLLFYRLRHRELQMKTLMEEKETAEAEFITVRADRINHQIRLKDITYLESLSDYVKIHFNGQSLTTKETISSFEKSLPSTFLRIHRSYIINRSHLLSFSSTSVHLKELELPVSRKYKAEVVKILSGEPGKTS
jgi:heme/copper-type cytochrome/quinol oxidase subunit 2